MVKLNQVLAIEKGVKIKNYNEITEEWKKVQKSQLLHGIQRDYKPREDGGEVFPSESQRVQIKAPDVLVSIQDKMEDMWNVVATKEWGNMTATGTIRIDDEVILADVPVTFLLYLEKQLKDIHEAIKVVPTLDSQFDWEPVAGDEGLYRTTPVTTVKTQKRPKVIVKYAATTEHPAQTEIFNEDVVIGEWTTTNLSGAIPADRKKVMLDRVESLRRAVKVAREEANNQEVNQRKISDDILSLIFA